MLPHEVHAQPLPVTVHFGTEGTLPCRPLLVATLGVLRQVAAPFKGARTLGAAVLGSAVHVEPVLPQLVVLGELQLALLAPPAGVGMLP